MMLLTQACLAALSVMVYFDWRKERKVWQIPFCVYMLVAAFALGFIGANGGAA